MNPDYINQILLNTGDVTHSLRAQVSTPALVVVRPLLAKPGEIDVPDLDAKVTTHHLGAGVLLRVVGKDGDRCAIAIATRSRDGAKLWRDLHETGIAASLPTDPDRPPSAPWCGLVLADQMRRAPHEATMALVVLARVAGWAWIEAAP